MPDLSERSRGDEWTAFAAEPAVRAAERAIVTESPTLLADTLAVSTAAESRRHLANVLDLKHRAQRDARSREAYQRAADEFRNWAARVYLAALRVPHGRLSFHADADPAPKELTMPDDALGRWEWEGGAVAAADESAAGRGARRAAGDRPLSNG